jgi:hypothetical protein
MNKPRIRVKVNNETNTVTFLNPQNKWGWQVVDNQAIKKAQSFVVCINT